MRVRESRQGEQPRYSTCSIVASASINTLSSPRRESHLLRRACEPRSTGAQAGTAAAAAARSRLRQTAAGSRQQAVARRESAEIGGIFLLGRRLSKSGKSNQVVVFLLRGGG
jgi:hypothetical protein